ncbi:MAG TPA: iron ABC transporter permease [Candidatus Nanopelagicaceae bacterium]|nr:iron ABC transporter permease [Candidatus Nanopelagicaceae bacterium]
MTVALAVLAVALVMGVTFGPVSLSLSKILRTIFGIHGGLTGTDRVILLQLRLPRVVLATLVGAALAASGAAYQTVFRNPLADPYLLGVAAGAGLGATLAFIGRSPGVTPSVPIFAFVGGVISVGATLMLAGAHGRDPVTVILAGIAFGAFATAIQTYLQQRNTAVLRPVYSWILGQLNGAGWTSVRDVAPYIIAALATLHILSRRMDALMLSDDEARSLGVNPGRLRLMVILTATLATSTAVAASGLIGFVGIVVPHLIRSMTHRATSRAITTIAVAGGAFLVLADLGARTIVSPAELPIGVITAFVGAPFFLFVLRARGRGLT